MEEKQEKKPNIKSIRGIDDKLYEQLTVLARESGRTVGELVNEAMRLLLTLANKTSDVGKALIEGYKEGKGAHDVEVISNIDELEITREDLLDMDKLVEFKNIKKLIFKDVPYDLFDKKVRKITMCGEVVVPRGYPKLKVARKCFLVTKIVTQGD